MRCSQRTLITASCTMLVLAAFWQVLDLTVMPNAAAQSEPPAATQTMKKGDVFEELGRSRIEAILNEPIPEITIQQIPLREALAELKKLTGVSMYFDDEELGDVIDPDVPIDVQVNANSMTYKTFIKEFLLGPQDLVFVIRHNYLVVMSYDKYLGTGEAVQLIVYNCRDLLVGFPEQSKAAEQNEVPGGEGVEGSGGDTAVPGEAGSKPTENLHQFGTVVGGVPGPFAVPQSISDIRAREQQLVDLIRMTVINEDFPWGDGSIPTEDDGATIEFFNGLLVVRTLPEVHEKVRQLLRLLRESAKEQDWPADLGDWPHRKRNPHPATGMMGVQGGNFF